VTICLVSLVGFTIICMNILSFAQKVPLAQKPLVCTKSLSDSGSH